MVFREHDRVALTHDLPAGPGWDGAGSVDEPDPGPAERKWISRRLDASGVRTGDEVDAAEFYAPVELTADAVGTVVGAYGDGGGYEVEFVDAEGRTIAVVRLGESDLRPI